MGLITKTVTVKWYPKKRKYYEGKGYKFTKWYDEFKCKIEDLSKGSAIKVQVKCDGKDCNEILDVCYSDYINHSHNGKYYCVKCSHELFGKEKIKRTKLKSSKSFYDWCYENLDKKQADNIINRWNYELNKCSPKDISFCSHGIDEKGYYFKCDKHKNHKSELHNIKSFIRYFIKNGKSNVLDCNQCNSFAQYLINTYGNDALEKYWDYNKNIVSPWNVEKSSNKKVWIKCQEKIYHSSYGVTCDKFTLMNVRCPYCCHHNGLVHSKDSLGQYIIDNFGEEFLKKVYSDKNKKSAFEYSPNSGQKVWWKCFDKKHKDYYRKINESNIAKFRCPECVNEMTESVIQNKTRLYLENLHIGQVLHEYNCTLIPINPKTKQQLPFDNEIQLENNINLIIEVMGEQHYIINGWHITNAKKHNTTPEYELHYQKLKDRYKRIIAYKNEYEYIAIPYTYFNDKDNTYKNLINNKINEILNKKERK